MGPAVIGLLVNLDPRDGSGLSESVCSFHKVDSAIIGRFGTGGSEAKAVSCHLSAGYFVMAYWPYLGLEQQNQAATEIHPDHCCSPNHESSKTIANLFYLLPSMYAA